MHLPTIFRFGPAACVKPVAKASDKITELFFQVCGHAERHRFVDPQV
jgi:hypothetical protein